MMLFRNKQGSKQSILASMAELRVSKDLEELKERRTSSRYCYIYISLPQRDRQGLAVSVFFTVKPDIGHAYSGATFATVIQFGDRYPFCPPTVLVLNRVYHPNIDIDTGEFCLDLLTPQNWKPIITLGSLIFAVELTILEPNFNYVPHNAINEEMVIIHKMDSEEFARIVRRSLLGGPMGVYEFTPLYGHYHSLKRKLSSEPWERRRRVKVMGESEGMQLDPREDWTP